MSFTVLNVRRLKIRVDYWVGEKVISALDNSKVSQVCTKMVLKSDLTLKTVELYHRKQWTLYSRLNEIVKQ